MAYHPKVHYEGPDKLVFESGATLEVKDGATVSLPADALEVPDIALADGKILVGDAAGSAAAVTPSGDVTITNAGVTAIGAAKVTAAMLANGAGVAALLTAGLGDSANYDSTTNGAQSILAADAGARVALVVAIVTEDFADGAGGQTAFTIGEEDTANKYAASTVFADASAGDVFILAGTLTATKALIVTGTPATGDGTGALAVTALVLPAAA